ncbi:MAG: kelch repeat-containing protein, partial [Thermoplasmata archaeon]
MVSKKRLYERFRTYHKAFKQNWDLFKASRIGLVGLAILIFFLVIALITPALNLRDPINWRAPEEDLIKVDRYWYVDTTTPLYNAGNPVNQSVSFRLVPKGTGPPTDRIYFASGEKVIALRPKDGHRVWYVGRPGNDVCCYQADSLVTAGPLVANYGSIDNPVYSDWVLYFGTESGEFYQLKEADEDYVDPWTRASLLPSGKNVSRTTLGSKITSIAVYADESTGRNALERVFVGTEHGNLYAFSAIWKDDESWSYNTSSDMWVRVYPEVRPLPQDKHIMAYSPKSRKILLVSGDNGLETDFVQTWIFDLAEGNWTKLDNLKGVPPSRMESAMVYIPGNDSALLYGGRWDHTILDDLWTFNFSSETWSEGNTTSSPGPRNGHSMAYGSKENSVYLFGGRGDDNNKTMKLNLTTMEWTEVSTNESAIARMGISMIYDLLKDRLIIFGGDSFVSSDSNNQTKVLNLSSGEWSWIYTPPNLTPRAWQSMVYDNVTNSAILFGGMDKNGKRIDEMWKLNLTNDSWDQLDSSLSPSARFGLSMVSLGNSQMFLFGGDDYAPSELWNKTANRGPIVMASLPLKEKHNPRFSPAVYSVGGDEDGKYLVYNDGGYLNCIWTDNGTQMWDDDEYDYVHEDGTILIGEDWSTAPMFSTPEGNVPSLIYLATSNGYLHAFYKEDGGVYESWAIPPPGKEDPDGDINPQNNIIGIAVRKTLAEFDRGVLTRPDPYGDYIYVGSDTGFFYSIRRDRTRDIPAGRVRGKFEAPVAPGERFMFNTPPYYHRFSETILISGYSDNGTLDSWTDDMSTIFSMNTDGNVSWKQTFEGRVNGALTVWRDEAGSEHLHMSVFAGLTDGTIQVYSSSGKYLAPLAPTWIEPVPSGNTYWLGTDNQGRDLFSQWMWGTRVALTVGLLAAFFSISIGVIIGLVAGYTGGRVDSVLMRFTDVILVLPGLPLVIILAAVLGAGIWNIILVISIVGWPGTARVIRSEVLSLKERPFIDSARVSGASNIRIMFKHIAPNVLPLAFLYMTFAVSAAILTEAALSFIGLGDVNTPSWGQMLMLIQQSNVLGSWW